MSRTARRFEAGGRVWRLVEAWHGQGGHGLCYFLALRGTEPASDDRLDRRAALEPGEKLVELSPQRLLELEQESVPLTDTERRFQDAEGRSWLAQNSGPVWAEGGVAEGLTGVVFTSLDGPYDRLYGPAGHLEFLSESELAALLEATRAG